MADPRPYDQNHPDEDRGYIDSPDAHHFTRSRTPEQRRAERAARELARRQASVKGGDGVDVRPGLIQADPLEAHKPGGSGGNLTPVFFGCCTNGVFTVTLIPVLEVPSPP